LSGSRQVSHQSVWHFIPKYLDHKIIFFGLNKELYRVLHDVLCDYKHLQQKNQRTYLNGIVHSHRKTEKVLLTTRYFPCVHHGWHGTHRYDIQVVATQASTCWRVCGNNLNIVSMCAVSPVVHTPNISCRIKKIPVAVKNSIKVGPLVFLL
jgi:hypothetical protein